MKKKAAKIEANGAVLYLRVSTAKQAESGLGIEAQEAACRAHAARLGLPVLSIHIDRGISGKEPVEKRPGLKAALDAVKEAPGAVCVVYSLSRLARSQRLIWNLLDASGGYGLPVSSATENFETVSAMGRAVLGMIGTFAQLESDLASERTRDALAAARERGVKLGAPTMAEKMAPELLDRIKGLYGSGKYTHKSLAALLNSEGIPALRGGVWYPTTVRIALMTNPT